MAGFRFADNENLEDLGGDVAKYRANIAALALIKATAGREVTDDERAILSHYTGWGSTPVLRQAFPPENRYRGDDEAGKVSPELAAMGFDPAEISAMRASILNAHYTAIPVVRGIWDALIHLGVRNLVEPRFLEPAAGIGHFYSAMPDDLEGVQVAIELDKLTGQLLKLLHPELSTWICGFQEAELPDDYFDVQMSNVPFGNYGVSDTALKDHFLKVSIHDYFFAKAVTKAKPGGIIAFITSRYTLDKKDNRVRAWLAERCDLLGCVRLPDNAFVKNAGTTVVTDILILRKKGGVEYDSLHWTESVPLRMRARNGYSNVMIDINQVYHDHPELMLGVAKTQQGMYGDDEFTLESDGRALREAIAKTLCNILPKDILFSPPEAVEEEEAARNAKPLQRYNLWSLPQAATPDMEARSEALRGVYEVAKQLLADEIAGKAETAQLARDRLNFLYDGFVTRFGCINSSYNLKAMQGNAAMPFLRALEKDYDPLSRAADKASIFTRPVVREIKGGRGWEALEPMERATAALFDCLDKRGKVDIARIARATGDTHKGVIEKLKGQIYLEPKGGWQSAEEYLSGDVVGKLEQAELYGALEPVKYHLNIEALRHIQPEPLTSGQITAHMGVAWIPSEYVHQFLKHIIPGLEGKVTYLPSLSKWLIEPGVPHEHYTLDKNAMKYTWGTSRRDALEIAEDALGMHVPIIKDEDGNGTMVINSQATVIAQAKLEEMKAAFSKWIWEDGVRAKRLVEIYNRKYNCFRARSYDGSHLSLSGFNPDIHLMPHQADAIWRSIQSVSTLMGHCVGAGKTMVGVAGAMERIRIGKTHKALAVVPNHLTEQWMREALNTYPNINVLIASKDDMTKKNRPAFMSRIATNQWDLIIVPMSSFKLLPVSNATLAAFMQEEIAAMRLALKKIEEVEEEGHSYFRRRKKTRPEKEIEKIILKMQVKLQNLLAMAKDDNRIITWEELGVDHLIVDEAHMYKNLYFATSMTRVPGLPNSHSERAQDMFVKVQWTMNNGGAVQFLTGTPVMNTLAEVFTMMRYLQLPLLKSLGLETFDQWAQMFAEVVPSLEMTPDGSGFRINSRFSKFVNLPELAALWRQCLDVRTAEQLKLPTPTLHRGKPLVVTTPASPELQEYIQQLAKRAEIVKSPNNDPRVDNMLKIVTDGRLVALEPKLRIPYAKDRPDSKINGLIENVYSIWKGSEPRRGVQLIFCDLGTPKPIRPIMAEENIDASPEVDSSGVVNVDDIEDMVEDVVETKVYNDVYNDIRTKLVAIGMPEGEIAFIHDAKTPKARSALFDRVRAGEVRVLIGSTEKMGTGMNVQNLLIALHHLDAPWRPGDIEQRSGRIMRRGNLYPEVAIFNYVTEGSFDGYTWQLLVTKARYISQIMAGEITERTADDVGDVVLSMEEIKGLASGNPRVMQKVVMENELIKLSHLYAAWHSSHTNMRVDLVGLPPQIEHQKKELALNERVLKVLKDWDADEKPFAMALVDKLNSETLLDHDNREHAGMHIRDLAEEGYQIVKADPLGVPTKTFVIGRYKGFVLWIKSWQDPDRMPELWPVIEGDSVEYFKATIGASNLGVIASLDAQLRGSEAKAAVLRMKVEALTTRQATLTAEVGKEWEHTVREQTLKRKLAILNVELQGGKPAPEQRLEELPGFEVRPELVSEFSLEEIKGWLTELHTNAAYMVPAEVVPAGITPAAIAMPQPVDEVAVAIEMERIEAFQAYIMQQQLRKAKKAKKVVAVPEGQTSFGW